MIAKARLSFPKNDHHPSWHNPYANEECDPLSTMTGRHYLWCLDVQQISMLNKVLQ